MYAKLLRVGYNEDVALLGIGAPISGEGPIEREALKLSDAACEEGDKVIVCGFPFGLRLHKGSEVTSSFATGRVSAIRPTSPCPPEYRSGIQLDFPVLPGASGGPVVSMDTGEAVGLIVSTTVVPVPKSTPDGQPVPVGFGHAVDAWILRQLVEGVVSDV